MGRLRRNRVKRRLHRDILAGRTKSYAEILESSGLKDERPVIDLTPTFQEYWEKSIGDEVELAHNDAGYTQAFSIDCRDEFSQWEVEVKGLNAGHALYRAKQIYGDVVFGLSREDIF